MRLAEYYSLQHLLQFVASGCLQRSFLGMEAAEEACLMSCHGLAKILEISGHQLHIAADHLLTALVLQGPDWLQCKQTKVRKRQWLMAHAEAICHEVRRKACC